MTALAANRSTKKVPPEGVLPDLSYVPVAASTKIYQGALVGLDANGRLVAGTALLFGQQAIGRAEELKDNSAGAAGAVSCTVRHGVFKWGNSAAADAIAQANVGQRCYVVDDQTVALTDNNRARAYAGIVYQVDTDGVWVLSGYVDGLSAFSPAPGSQVTFQFNLADISATDIVAKWQPGFAGRIVKFQAVVMKPATTGAKAATITPQINAALGADVPVTGGVLALTSANMTPIGNAVQSTAITGANAFGAADGISLLASAVTTFIEGIVALTLTLG